MPFFKPKWPNVVCRDRSKRKRLDPSSWFLAPSWTCEETGYCDRGAQERKEMTAKPKVVAITQSIVCIVLYTKNKPNYRNTYQIYLRICEPHCMRKVKNIRPQQEKHYSYQLKCSAGFRYDPTLLLMRSEGLTRIILSIFSSC